MILFYPQHYKSRQGQAEGDALNIIFMVLYYPIPDLKERDPSITILNIASFSGSFITPTPEGKGRDPRLPILHTASRRPRTPYPKCS